MYVCMYVAMYVCMLYVCMYVCMHVCMYVCMYVCMHVCMYVYVCMYTYVCMYVCMYVYMYRCMYVCMYVCNACIRILRYVRMIRDVLFLSSLTHVCFVRVSHLIFPTGDISTVLLPLATFGVSPNPTLYPPPPPPKKGLPRASQYEQGRHTGLVVWALWSGTACRPLLI